MLPSLNAESSFTGFTSMETSLVTPVVTGTKCTVPFTTKAILLLPSSPVITAEIGTTYTSLASDKSKSALAVIPESNPFLSPVICTLIGITLSLVLAFFSSPVGEMEETTPSKDSPPKISAVMVAF